MNVTERLTGGDLVTAATRSTEAVPSGLAVPVCPVMF